MKLRHFVIFGSILFLLLFLFLYQKTKTHDSHIQEQPPPQVTTIPTQTSHTIQYEDVEYSYDYIFVHDLTKLKLISNFVSQTRGSTLAKQNNCIAAVNGGFYSTDNKPLGAFVSDDYIQDHPIQSALLNGYFGYTDTKADISTTFDPTYPSILQSGPLLIQHSSPLLLQMTNDEHARRTAVGIANDMRVVFITIYIQDSIYNGPLLEELPFILKLVADDLGIPISTALNLDGGSATYFKSKTQELPELSSVGSIFCLQN